MKLNLFLYLGVLSVVALTTSTYAQQMEDVLYLKNGSIIRGIIIEQTPNVSIKIKTKDGSIFAYKYEEIEKFAKEEVKGLIYADDYKKIGEHGFKSKKFFIGLKAGYGDWGNVTYGLSLDYAISNYFGLGLDVAYTTWEDNGYTTYDFDTATGYTSYTLNYSYSLIGLLLNFSYHFNPGEKFDPYVKTGGGYFLINSTTKWSPRKPTGFTYSPTAEASGIGYGGQAGFNYFFSKSFSLSVSGGWPFYASGGVTIRL
jgi:opacity protein-like surface antigen